MNYPLVQLSLRVTQPCPFFFFFIAYPDHFPGRTWGLEGTISSEAKTMPTQSHSYQKSVLGCQLWVVLQPFRAPFYQILPSSVIIKRRQSKEKTEPAFYPLVCPCVLIVSRKNSIWRRGLKRSFPFFFFAKGWSTKDFCINQSQSFGGRWEKHMPAPRTQVFVSNGWKMETRVYLAEGIAATHVICHLGR